MLKHRFAFFSLITLLLAVAAPAGAQDHPNFARGLGQPTSYHGGDFDSVNLFNGGLGVAIPIGPRYPLGGGLGYGLTLHYNSGIWDFEEGPVENGSTTVEANPQPFNEAGLGWTIGLGRLHAPFTSPYNDGAEFLLVEADGTRRVFRDRLHLDDPLTAASYTRDGSYLRMKVDANGERRVEAPDGSVRVFRTDGKLRQIADVFGNFVNVNYPSAWVWQLADQHGRTQTVTLLSSTTAIGQVSRIDFDGFGAAIYSYHFNYSIVSLPRHSKDTYSGNTPSVAAALLTSITLPDGSTFAFSSYPSAVIVGNEVQPPGALSSLTLPTLGRTDYAYGAYSFPQQSFCSTPPCLPAWIKTSDGVRTKKIVTAAGAIEGTWTYRQIQDASTTRSRTVVTSPIGHDTVHSFRLSPYDWTHGLAYDPAQPDATGTRFLSQAVYHGAYTANQLKRRTFVRYTADRPSRLDANQRIESSRSVFDDDGGRFADVTFSSFDGLGHYRQATTGGSFDAGNARTDTTNFNPPRGTYAWDHANSAYGAGHNFTMWPLAERWVLGTFTDTTASEGAQAIKAQYCFERDGTGFTGFLSRVRSLKGSLAGATDVLAVHTRDAAGNLIREQRYGGDVQTLGTTADPCLLALPATDQYRVDHAYAYGVQRFAEAKSAAGGTIGLVLLDRDVDSSGMISTDRDGAGIATAYEYDTAGRTIWAKPQVGQGAWTQTTYTLATPTAAYLTIATFQRPNGSKTAAPLAESHLLVDQFGRPWRERVRMPNGTLSSRDTLYNALGWTVSISEWGALTKKTTLSLFDPFGRPGKITPPDGAVHDVNLVYFGEREVSRQSKVWTSTAGETSVFTTHRYDRQGRLYQVVEQSGGTSANITTTYGYDAASRLKSVSTPVSIAGTTVTQNRTFTYDNRGFLTSERHPEKGAFGNGTVTYSSYDAMGLPRRVIDGPSDLTITRDRGGRPLQVRTTATNELLVDLVYGTSNLTGDWRKGKLVSADRYNHLSVGTTPYLVQLRETFAYGGPGGHPSALSTSWANATSGELFLQGWSYDDLGNMTRITYPRCAQAGCTGAAATSRLVDSSYTNGTLTAVTGYASPISYHVNGTLSSVTHANGVVWSQTADPNSMPRPAAIQATAGASTLWNTGGYAFDGTGNVRAIGSSTFLYDAVSRLTSASMITGPLGVGGPLTQGFTYDGFGNMTAISGSGGRNIPTDAATNRLTTVGAGPTCEVNETYYDAGGNLLCWQGNSFTYDPLGAVIRTLLSGNEYDHAYSASGERLLTYQPGVGFRWTFRDLDGRVLRELNYVAGTWTVERDYVYRDGAPLASVQPTGEVYHLHPDHLGSPRLVTGNGGLQRAFHTYFAFGEEATTVNQDAERLKFTGHERDLGTPANAADDIDFQHARYYSQLLERYLSTDPIGGDMGMPQSWNLYAYVLGNPMTYLDPYGLDETPLAEFFDEITVRGYHDEITVSAKNSFYFVGRPGGSGPQSGESIIGYANRVRDLGGTGRCDWSCQVMQGVSKSSMTGTVYLESAVHFLAMTAITGGLGGGGRGALVGVSKALGRAPGAFTRGSTASSRIVTSNGIEITGLTRHGINRAIGDGGSRAGVRPEAILDAMKNPLKIIEGVDDLGRPFHVFHGASARVVVNPQSGRVVSMNPLSRAGRH